MVYRFVVFGELERGFELIFTELRWIILNYTEVHEITRNRKKFSLSASTFFFFILFFTSVPTHTLSVPISHHFSVFFVVSAQNLLVLACIPSINKPNFPSVAVNFMYIQNKKTLIDTNTHNFQVMAMNYNPICLFFFEFITIKLIFYDHFFSVYAVCTMHAQWSLDTKVHLSNYVRCTFGL